MKRVCLKELPPCLVVHLKRFDFDYETMQRLKLKEAFQFPHRLDMWPFTAEGLAEGVALERKQEDGAHGGPEEGEGGMDGERDQAEVHPMECSLQSTQEGRHSHGVGHSESPVQALPQPGAALQGYRLVGVVVHSGSAFAGHYYSFIRRRPGDWLPGREPRRQREAEGSSRSR